MEDENVTSVTNRENDLKKRQDIQYTFKSIGITLIVLSAISILSTIIALVVFRYWWVPYLDVGAGVWCSLLVIPLGVLLILSSRKATPCLVIWTFTWSVVASVLLLVTMAMSFCGGIYNSGIYQNVGGVTFFHLGLFGITLPQFVLSLYIAIRFGKISCSNSEPLTCGDMWSVCCWPQRNGYQVLYHPMTGDQQA
uniref:Uncharacterized protein LOC100182239 n=1 Tax=Phallusia mammillata TaxID=59560 RepID=A0A6F9DIA9_9ASCI|nr:uncharacterized protein LOC100182239 [Phallusia mammillata]